MGVHSGETKYPSGYELVVAAMGDRTRAEEFIESLAAAGFVIAPTTPTHKMLEAAGTFSATADAVYRNMLGPVYHG